MIDISKEELYDLYFNQKFTKKQLTNYFNCSEKVIDKRFEKWGWKFRKSGSMVAEFMKNNSKVKNETQNIIKLYLTDKKTCKYIGEIYNMSENGIAAVLKRNGINLRQGREAQIQRVLIKYEEIFDLYVNKQMSCKDIGLIFNCTDEVIRKILISFNIDRRDKCDVLKHDNIGARGTFKYGTEIDKEVISNKISKSHKKYFESDIDELLKMRKIIRISNIGRKSKITLKCLVHDHTFITTTSHLMRGDGCPLCRYKSESETYETLLKLFSTVKIERNFPLLKYTYNNVEHDALVDFYFKIMDKEIVVEYQGEQHYYPVFFSGKNNKKETLERFELQKFRDTFIREYCKQHDIILIEVDGREFKVGKCNIETFLIMKLKELNLC